MTAAFACTDTILPLLGAGPTQLTLVKQMLTCGVIRVAADGGAAHWLAAGVVPDVVIGDMDSFDPELARQIPSSNLHHVAEQETTDFEKCLQRIEAPIILAAGFMGGRLDHQLAVCSSLVKYAGQTCILIGDEDICFLAPEVFEIDLPLGTRLSLFPMGRVEGQSEGLLYPISGLVFEPWGQIGTSNEVSGPVRLQFSNRQMLVILPKKHLSAVIHALAPGRVGPGDIPDLA